MIYHSFINIRKIPREVLKLTFALGFQHLPRDLANVFALGFQHLPWDLANVNFREVLKLTFARSRKRC